MRQREQNYHTAAIVPKSTKSQEDSPKRSQEGDTEADQVLLSLLPDFRTMLISRALGS